MKEAKWVKFMEVFERANAELIKSYFDAHGIENEIIQESYEHFTYRFTMGRIEILVPDFQLKEARKLYEASGWDFEILEDDEDEE